MNPYPPLRHMSQTLSLARQTASDLFLRGGIQTHCYELGFLLINSQMSEFDSYSLKIMIIRSPTLRRKFMVLGLVYTKHQCQRRVNPTIMLAGLIQSAFKKHMCFFFHHCFFLAEIFKKCFSVLFLGKNVCFFSVECPIFPRKHHYSEGFGYKKITFISKSVILY